MNPDPITDPWITLGRWAEQRRRPLVVTLTEAPPEEAGLVGRIAVLEHAGATPRGPLAEAPFWPADWEILRESAAEIPPEGGRPAEVPLRPPHPVPGRPGRERRPKLAGNGSRVLGPGRRYLISSLVYNRSALVLGAGHVGGALARLLRFLEFEVTLVDDRPEFLQANRGATIDGLGRSSGAAAAAQRSGCGDGSRAQALAVEAPFTRLTELFAGSNVDAAAIVTRSHAEDTACLRQILRWPAVPPYLGMIGSRRRTRGTLDLLAGEGISPDLLRRVRTPIGLAIGAQTPEEIAVAIAGEIIQVLRQG